MPSVLITGANRGLGLEFARQYDADGWDVVACCRQPDKATALSGLGVEMHALDVTDPAMVSALAQGALAGRRFDVLINNAGVYGESQSLGKLDPLAWERAFRANVIGPIQMAEAFLPHLLAGDGKTMAFLSSIMGSIASNDGGGAYAYRSSKAALNAAVKSLALDLKGKATVLLLHPGWVKTDMGGAGAQITPDVSISGMRKVIAAAGPGDSGCFFDYRGRTLPW